MSKYIYADNAATTQLDSEALESMIPWLKEEYGNASQPYSFARHPKKALAEARSSIAKCINADPEEILFTSGGTESDNWAIKAVSVSSDSFRKEIITSAFEHHAVLRSCNAVAMQGNPIAFLQPSVQGDIFPESLSHIISDQTQLVSIMLANNEIGSIQPVRELSKIAHAHGAIFHTDAVQALGHISVDVQELGVDMLSASAHKFNGPKGIGFLYVRNGTKISPLLDGGSQEKKLRAGTENVAAIVGMAVALQNNCKMLLQNQSYIKVLESRFLELLQNAPVRYRRNGSNHTLPGLISLSFPDVDGEMLLHRLDLQGICISTGAACNSKETEVSHVLRAINLDERYAKGTVRISLGKYNTIEDVEAIVAALVKVLSNVSRPQA